MSTQYLRYCSITGEGGGSTIDISQLRSRFEIHPKTSQTPSQCILKVTNLSVEHAQKFVKKEFSKLTIEAGYEDHHGIIFKGNVVWGIYGRESPTDTLTTIYAYDGDEAHNYAVVNTTLAPGSTPKDHLDVALQAMGQFGVTKGYIGVDLSKPVYPRAVTLYGMARDVVRLLAQSHGAVSYYDKEELHVVPAQGNRPGDAIKLNSQSGLIGMPTQTTEAIWARCLINPQIRPLGLVHINEKDVIGGTPNINPKTGEVQNPGGTDLAPIARDGIYKVIAIDIFGDTRGQPWYMDLRLIAKTEGPGPFSTLPSNFPI